MTGLYISGDRLIFVYNLFLTLRMGPAVLAPLAVEAGIVIAAVVATAISLGALAKALS